MILSRHNDCPEGGKTAPGSPRCQKCGNFIKRRWYSIQGQYGVFCGLAMKPEDERHLTNNAGEDLV